MYIQKITIFFQKLANKYNYNKRKKIIKNIIEKNIIRDIAAGYGGVLVKPKFFNHMVYNIPDIFWTVDDIWLSGNLKINSIKIIRCTDAIKGLNFSKAHKINPLTRFIYKKHDRDSANFECIKYYNQAYGIWE